MYGGETVGYRWKLMKYFVSHGCSKGYGNSTIYGKVMDVVKDMAIVPYMVKSWM